MEQLADLRRIACARPFGENLPYILQLQLLLRLRLGLRLFRLRSGSLVGAGELLVEPVGRAVNSSGGIAQCLDGLIHFCHF